MCFVQGEPSSLRTPCTHQNWPMRVCACACACVIMCICASYKANLLHSVLPAYITISSCLSVCVCVRVCHVWSRAWCSSHEDAYAFKISSHLSSRRCLTLNTLPNPPLPSLPSSCDVHIYVCMYVCSKLAKFLRCACICMYVCTKVAKFLRCACICMHVLERLHQIQGCAFHVSNVCMNMHACTWLHRLRQAFLLQKRQSHAIWDYSDTSRHKWLWEVSPAFSQPLPNKRTSNHASHTQMGQPWQLSDTLHVNK